MKRCLLHTLAVICILAPAVSSAVTPDNSESYTNQGVLLQMTRTEGSVLNPGDEIGFRLQANQDGYLVVFNIDTEGFVNLLYPARGERSVSVREGETYLIPDDNNELLLVEGITGVEFVFALIVPERRDIDRQELDFLGKANSSPREDRYRIEGDPFIAANIIAGELVKGISHSEGVFLDYTYFFINERVAYPCYMCGECEGLQPDPDCADFLITSNFDQDRPFRYPLQRGYEMIEPAASPTTEDGLATGPLTDDRTFGQYASDDGTVNINFYPYNSEVYYETRETLTGATDVNIYMNQWDPYWVDPWYSGWYYAPRVSVGFYWGYPSFWWNFNCGYWGGYYCSAWYRPRCGGFYDGYGNNYGYYDGGYRYKPERYKDKYYNGDIAGGRTGYKEKTARPELYQTTYAQAAKRNSGMRIASTSVKGSRGSSSSTRVKSRTAVASSGSRSSYNKTTRVKNAGTRTSSKSRHTYAAKSARTYTPRSRGTYSGNNTTVKSGRTGYTGTRNKTTYRPVAPRSNTKSSIQRGRSSTGHPKSRSMQRSYTGSSSSKSRTGKSTYTGRSSSSSSKRSSSSTIKRSSGSSRSKSSSSVRSSGRSSSGSKSRSSGRNSSGGRSKSGGKGKR